MTGEVLSVIGIWSVRSTRTSTQVQSEYSIPRSGAVSLAVYDYLGREVRSWSIATQEAGRKQIRLDLGGLSSGVYILRLGTEGKASVSTVVVMR